MSAMGEEDQGLLERNVLLFVACVIVWLVSGGLVQGWGPIHEMLSNEGQFAELCPDRKCPEDGSPQEEALQNIVNTSFIALSLSSVVFGLSVDWIGPRLTASLGLLLSIAGNLLMAFSDSASFDAFLPGFGLIAAGGIGPYLSVMNFANLFHATPVVISILAGLFNLAGYTYMLPYYAGWARGHFFAGYAVLSAATLLACLATFPDAAYKPGDRCRMPVSEWCRRCRGGDADGQGGSSSRGGSRPIDGTGADAGGAGAARSSFWAVLWSSMVEARFLWLLLWYSLTYLLVSFVGGALPDIISRKAEEGGFPESKAELFATVLLPTVGNASFLVTPFVGLLIDRAGFVPVFLACIALLQALLLVLALGSFPLQVVSMALCAVLKSFMFTGFFAFIGVCFNGAIYGSLVAITTGVATLVGLAAFPMNTATQGVFQGDYSPLLFGSTAAICVLYGFPWLLSRAKSPGTDFAYLKMSPDA